MKIRLMKVLVWHVATYGYERTEKDSAGFVNSKENEWVGTEQNWTELNWSKDEMTEMLERFVLVGERRVM